MLFNTKVQKLFFKKELEALGSNDYRRLLFLSLLFCAIIFSIQVSYFSYEILEERMKDPYSNLLKTLSFSVIQLPNNQYFMVFIAYFFD